MIVKILTTYPNLSSEWLIMGRGEMLKTKGIKEEPTTEIISSKQEVIPASGEVIGNLVAQITQQAEEIGRLKERIATLEREQQKNASGATSGTIANAG